jgi:hypothetical protein
MNANLLSGASKNTSSRISIDIPKEQPIKLFASNLDRLKVGTGQHHIRICYGLELAASEFNKGNLKNCEDCLVQVRTFVLTDIPSLSPEYAAYALDSSIKYQIDNNIDQEQFFAKLGNDEYSVIEYIECQNGPRAKYLTLRGQCDLVKCLKGIHSALTQIKKYQTRHDDTKPSLDEIQESIVTAYKAVHPSSRKMGSKEVLIQMYSEV